MAKRLKSGLFSERKPFPSFRQFFHRRFSRWLFRRMPPSRSIYLNHKRVFVFPSNQGWVFCLLILLLWLVGTNYENNLALALAFLLISLFIISIIHTFNNLSGLTITGLSGASAFCGEDVEFEVLVAKAGRKVYENIQLSWPGGSVATVDLVDVAETRVKLFVPTGQRGRCNPERLLLETTYPLGLIRTWTWVDLDLSAVVYPKPIKTDLLSLFQTAKDQEGEAVAREGSEEFMGFKAYQVGSSLRHIAWKQYAQGRGLQLKDYADYHSPHCCLEWDSLAGMGAEERLSRLCFGVLSLAKTQTEYGLSLPGLVIAPGQGFEHKQQVLQALALFGLGDEAVENKESENVKPSGDVG